MPQNALAFTAVNKAGSVGPGFVDSQRALWIAVRHGKYYPAAFGGLSFQGANQSGATLSAGLVTTYTGLCLSNPLASTVNLVPKRIGGVIKVATAAALALGLIVPTTLAGITVHTTPITPSNALQAGAAVPNGLVDAACTLVGTPQWAKWIGEMSTGVGAFVLDLDGSDIIPPGGYMAIGASVAGSTAGLLGYIEWEELPPT